LAESTESRKWIPVSINSKLLEELNDLFVKNNPTALKEGYKKISSVVAAAIREYIEVRKEANKSLKIEAIDEQDSTIVLQNIKENRILRLEVSGNKVNCPNCSGICIHPFLVRNSPRVNKIRIKSKTIKK